MAGESLLQVIGESTRGRSTGTISNGLGPGMVPIWEDPLEGGLLRFPVARECTRRKRWITALGETVKGDSKLCPIAPWSLPDREHSMVLKGLFETFLRLPWQADQRAFIAALVTKWSLLGQEDSKAPEGLLKASIRLLCEANQKGFMVAAALAVSAAASVMVETKMC